eukprot:TRINITY_DN3698_c0_g1_i2.p1 TRINITY_DN3698_c0_g1~~TRINITY_DN3698_c0_g1_i2.p1  ORF type:complete len:390 (+),score=75.81 TRINITY_DN3698_c0_g1_i2:51-1172(+)
MKTTLGFGLLLVAGSMAESYRCAEDADCNFNGNCIVATGKCVCSKGWKGTACDELKLIPSDPSLGYQGTANGSKLTSWGGSVVLGTDGEYHMYASEITLNCGMNVWLSNSQVIHASSPDPAKVPFKKRGVVREAFAHEPIAAMSPEGDYVVYYTAVLPPNPLPVIGGKKCLGCKDGISVASCGTDGNRNASVNLPTYMVHSKNPNGPWSDPVMIPGTDVFADANFAPLIKPDGSLVALGRGSVYASPNWKDVSTYKIVANWPDQGEDPYIWQDANDKFHGIIHMGPRNATYGMHYYSPNGVNWYPTGYGGHAYEHWLPTTDGRNTSLACRERPHVILDSGKSPVALTNGASPVTCHLAGADDYSFTSLQVVEP